MKGKEVSTLPAVAMMASYVPSIQAYGVADNEPKQIQSINTFKKYCITYFHIKFYVAK